MKQSQTKGLSRRGFLGVTASAAAAGALAAPRPARAFGLTRDLGDLPPERQVPTFCEMCFWNCGAVARVRKNRVLSLRGHPGYPTARGKLCGRGNAGAATIRRRRSAPATR